MSAASMPRSVATFAPSAQIHIGAESVAIDAQLGQELLKEIGSIEGLQLGGVINNIVISLSVFGERDPNVHRITIQTEEGRDHVVHFEIQKGERGEPGGVPPTESEESPEAKVLELYNQVKACLKGEREKYALSHVKLGPTDLGKVSEISEKWVIPLSDIFAIVRNGLGLVMIILILTGMGPLAPIVVALGIAFSICLIVQGTLFAFPQGTFAWGAKGASKFMVVRSLSDVQHKRGMALKTFSGFLSFVEGLLWIALGLSGIVPVMAGAAGILTFILFNVFFTCSFLLMTGMGIADFRRHHAFREKMMELLGASPQRRGFFKAVRIFLGIDAVEHSYKNRNKEWTKEWTVEQCDGVIGFLKRQVSLGEGMKKEQIKAAARSVYRLEEQTDGDIIGNLFNMMTLEEKRDFVIAVLKANEINLNYDIWTVRLGIIGTIVGGLIYNILHLLGLELIGQAADFAAWMPLNAGFLILDVDWIVPALVEGNLKKTAKEKLLDPVKGWFQRSPQPASVTA